jgi:hypothetical protein
MSGSVTLKGTVVDKDPATPLPARPDDGLYLLTENNQLLALITDSMAAQMPIDLLHTQSRPDFEPYLGKKVTVEGYASGDSLYSARIVDK